MAGGELLQELSNVSARLPTRVRDGARTRDLPDHNRGLYRLSYSHHDPSGLGKV